LITACDYSSTFGQDGILLIVFKVAGATTTASAFGNSSGSGTLAVAALLARLLDLAVAVTELCQAQQHAAQAAAARRAAEHLHCAHTRARSRAAQAGWAARAERAGRATAPAAARNDFPGPFRLEDALLDDPAVASHHSRPGPAVGPSRRAGSGP